MVVGWLGKEATWVAAELPVGAGAGTFAVPLSTEEAEAKGLASNAANRMHQRILLGDCMRNEREGKVEVVKFFDKVFGFNLRQRR